MKQKVAKTMQVVIPDEVINAFLTVKKVKTVVVSTRTTERAKELAGWIHARIEARSLAGRFKVLSVWEGEKDVRVVARGEYEGRVIILADDLEANLRKNEKEAMAELAEELRVERLMLEEWE
jgi:hypothetical protein